VISFKEKPNYTYYANAGIYLIKKEILDVIPKETVFNATDLLDEVIADNKRLIHYPIRGYWLDIGKHEDFEKAMRDIEHINWY
jgi:NDP-sugar pyrophosphorylase family protein